MAPVTITIRVARVDEVDALEALQRRASLANPGDRDAILAHPEAIVLPPQQIVDGQVFVAEAPPRFSVSLTYGTSDTESGPGLLMRVAVEPRAGKEPRA